MSRLIRNDTTNTAVEAEAEGAVPQTPESILEHLKKCQAIASQNAQQVFKKYLDDFDEALRLAMDNATSNNEATELNGLHRQFSRNRAELERYYIGYMAEGFVKFKKKELYTELQGSATPSDILTLVDNDELDETITMSSIVQRVDVLYAEPIWALNQRFAVLSGGDKVVDASNPASPIQMCESLRRALRLIPLTAKAKNIAYKVYERWLNELARSVIDDINLYLKGAGVLPNLRYAPSKSSSSEPAHASPHAQQSTTHSKAASGSEKAGFAPLPDPKQSSEQYQKALLQAIRGLQISMAGGRRGASDGGRRVTDSSDIEGGGSPLGAGVLGAVSHSAAHLGAGASGNPLLSFIPVPGGTAGSTITNEQLMAALQILQANTFAAGAPSLGSGAVPLSFGQVLTALGQQFQQGAVSKDSKVSSVDMNTIDLVGMVFEFMLKDENLPDSIKTLLSYMHTPFLKLAFIDPGFFEKSEHPARLLLNALAEAGVRWVSNDGTSQHDIYEKIKAAVERVLSDFKTDPRIISELLVEFGSYTSGILRRQELVEKRAAEKAEGEERLREVKISVNDQIRKRTDGKDWPASVLLFLLQPWADYLSFALLRYGDNSDKWRDALELVDDLLWAIQSKSSEADLARQRELAQSLVNGIAAGFESIGYEQSKGSRLTEAIISLIEMAQEKKIAEPASAPVRDELEKTAAEKAGQQMFKPTDISDDEAAIVSNLKLIEFGTWFEFTDGKRLKIGWYNARTSHYMLVDQMGKKVAMMSGLEIAREMLAKHAKIIAGSSKPFFERALENIFQKLNAESANRAGSPVEQELKAQVESHIDGVSQAEEASHRVNEAQTQTGELDNDRQ